MRDLTAEFREFLEGFARYRKAALDIESPNVEDDEFIRAAIVGFSQHAPTEQWARGHHDFVSRYRDGDYSDESLSVLHGEQVYNYALLACLCLGALLGLYQAGRITEDEFKVAEAQLPGFMALHVGRL